MQNVSPAITMQIEPGAEEINLDPSCAKRIFTELLSNAVLFTSPDRPLSLRFKAERLKDGYVTCALSDNGIGISEKDLSKVTGLFQRLAGNGHSSTSGLGLSIAKAVVNREGGELWLAKNEDVGTTVFFELPAIKPH